MQLEAPPVQPKSYVYYEGDPAQSCIARFTDVVRYSLKAFNGRLLVNGGRARAMHGTVGELSFKLLIEFPQRRDAEEWYRSALVTLLLDKWTVWPDGNLLVLEGVVDP